MILSGEVSNPKTDDLVFDKPEEDLLKEGGALKRERSLKDRFLENAQAFTYVVQILDTSRENAFQPNENSKAIHSEENIHPHTNLTKIGLKQNIANLVNSFQVHLKNKEALKFSHYMPLHLLVDTEHEAWGSTQPELDYSKLTETLDPTNEHNKENVIHRTLDPEKLSNILDIENPAQAKVPFEDKHTTPVNLKNSGFQIKTESVIKHSPDVDKPDISYSEKGKEKIRESPDIYGSKFSSLKFEEELKATQEVRNSKHYSTQEHKVFHVKLEDGDLRIRLVKDRLNISLNLKEDIRLPTPHESYRLLESLSQMGLRVEFFGINGKTLQWEFRQGQEGKRESKFKDVSLNSKDDNKVFSLYL
ncbi:hypothetical protein [Thermocrinis sp.]|uniref:hypothetical protein n=1 Tax=Thermocrinis sp. TaxID=2024383 RepID=UPI002FDD4F83